MSPTPNQIPRYSAFVQTAWEKVELFFGDQLRNATCWAPVFLGLGIGLYFSLRFEPTAPLSLWFIALCIPALWCVLARSAVVRGTALVVLLVVAGVAVATFKTSSVSAPVLGGPFIGTIEGRFVGSDVSQSGRTRIMLEDITLYGQEDAPPRRVRISVGAAGEVKTLSAGDRILVFARVSPPGAPVEAGGFDFRRYAWFRGLGGVGFALGPVLPSLEPPDTSLAMGFQRARFALANTLRDRLGGDAGSFAAAILVGDRSTLDKNRLEELRASNLAHLLAISGLHMGLVTGLVFGLARLLLSFFPRTGDHVSTKAIAAAAAIIAGAVYLAFSGASIATQRAFMMAMVAFGAMIVRRPALTLRAVALAALLILLYRPESLLEAGFQMSFAATTGLIAIFGYLGQRPWWTSHQAGTGKIARWAAALLVSSATAGLATAPFAAFHFNQVAQYGLVANLLAVPIMGLVVMPSLLLGLATMPLGLSFVPFTAAALGIDGILLVAQTVAGWEGSTVLVPKGPNAAIALIALGGAVAVILARRSAMVGVLLVMLGFGTWFMSDRPDVMIDPGGKLVGILEDGARSLNQPKGQGFAARVWLENDGDRADQAAAAKRFSLDLGPASKGTGMILAKDGQVGIAKVPSRRCQDGEVAVLLGDMQPPQGGCTILDQAFIEREGAVSIYWSSQRGYRVKTARSVSGKRPWVQQGNQ